MLYINDKRNKNIFFFFLQPFVKTWKSLMNSHVSLQVLDEEGEIEGEQITGTYVFDPKTNILAYRTSRIKNKVLTSKISLQLAEYMIGNGILGENL